MGRGKGIPIEIRRKIAKHFEENGFDEKTRKQAREIYENSSNSKRDFAK